MTKKFYRAALLVVMACLMIITALPVNAEAYKTYVYSITGEPMDSPNAYRPVQQIDSKYMGLDVPLNNPTDLFAAANGDIYIADPSNNRIVRLNQYFKVKQIYSTFVNPDGLNDSLLKCEGCFVTPGTDMWGEYLYVADTDNARIVIFNLDGTVYDIIGAPESDVFRDDALYTPVSLAVDHTGRMYVVSTTTNEGVITMDPEGNFQGCIGANTVQMSALELFFSAFQSAEMKAKATSKIPAEFDNIAIDEEGFLFVVSSRADIKEAVKRLNAAGDNILANSQYATHYGELKVNKSTINSSIVGDSTFVDIAAGPEETWSVIDSKRSKIFTYDKNGNLLFAFGDMGMKMGQNQSLSAITYRNTDLLLLDKATSVVTVYTRTEYGDIVLQALANDNNQNYETAVEDYKRILQRNTNFDIAYIGIGKAMYRQYDWEGAMDYFKLAYDITNYNVAYKQFRRTVLSKSLIYIAIGVVALVWFLSWFLGFAKKVNDKAAISGKKRHFGHDILYGFHLIMHPFDGFWDLKHEKRGTVKGGIFWISVTLIALVYQSVGKGYMFNPRAYYNNAFVTVIGFLVPLFLWIISNWCLTTLFEGEGSFRDIFIATSYSTVPLAFFIIPSTIYSNFATLTEASMVNLLVTLGWVWTGMLLFFGTMITHDYSLVKNAITCLGTIVGMAFLIFIAVLFSSLLMKVVGFISSIATELAFRM